MVILSLIRGTWLAQWRLPAQQNCTQHSLMRQRVTVERGSCVNLTTIDCFKWLLSPPLSVSLSLSLFLSLFYSLFYNHTVSLSPPSYSPSVFLLSCSVQRKEELPKSSGMQSGGEEEPEDDSHTPLPPPMEIIKDPSAQEEKVGSRHYWPIMTAVLVLLRH